MGGAPGPTNGGRAGGVEDTQAWSGWWSIMRAGGMPSGGTGGRTGVVVAGGCGGGGGGGDRAIPAHPLTVAARVILTVTAERTAYLVALALAW